MSTTTRRRRRKRAVGTSADKWKSKVWFDIRVPDYIGEQSLGLTPSTTLQEVVGRTIQTSLMEITNNFSDLNYHLSFKITKVAGRKANTEFFGQELSRDYRRSQIRNHRSQADGTFNLTLNDGARIRVTTFVVTPFRAAHNTKKEIRAAVKGKIEEICQDLNFPAFVNKLISFELRDELLPPAEDIFPIKLLEISKVKVLKLPADRQMQDVSDLDLEDAEEITIDDEDEEEEEEEDN